jgi:excisionase family DNA binding protein
MNFSNLPEWLPRRLMTVEEVAEIVRQSPRQIRRYIADGRLPVTKAASSVRVTPEALATFLGLL